MPLVKPSLPPRSSPAVDKQTQQVPKFAPCPRSTFTTEQTKWFQITTPHTFSDLDICQSCYETTFRNTPYVRCFSEAPPKPKNIATKCDFSDRWNRVATSWLFSQNTPDLTLLGHVAEMQPDDDGPCPNLNTQDPVAQNGGKPATKRTWFCLLDPETGSLIEDLTVCSSCVNRLNLIFPCLNNIFRLVSDGAKVEATCDLLTAQNENDARRGEQYMTKIIEAALQSLKTGTKNTHILAEYIKKWAPIPVCVRSQHVPQGGTSYTFATSIPSYAACEECYTVHIHPLLTSPSPPPILREIMPTVSPTGFTCDLYSPRLQGWFRDACATHDLGAYKQRLTERDLKTQEYRRRLEQMRLQVQQHERQAEMAQMQMVSAQSMEAASEQLSISSNIGELTQEQLDFSQSNAAMNQSHQAMLQAATVRENMELIRKEWAELYE
ncbi:hypothetical protein SVAN01_05687 [Stagonosporopsis vannaccii]|nr:hypothetical protein SVAN01_05687 [Stagonosporopsis vannaccii]